MSDALNVQVWVDLKGTPRLVGHLLVETKRGKEVASFYYADDWLRADDSFALSPLLQLSSGPYYASPGRTVFGPLADSAPDRWGQVLLRRKERMLAKEKGREPRTLREIDFLLGVLDVARQGALRFKLTEEGPFLAPKENNDVPPLVDLPRLLAASDRVVQDEEDAEDLRILLAPGSSLGGARPKASVRDQNGTLSIAKFSKPDDEYRVVAWEAVALELARRAAIDTEVFRLLQINGRDVLLVQRFDRRGIERIPFLSAMSMLDAIDGETRSYPEIADSIRMHGARPREDLRELWRRMVFTILVSNVDDHLRNHGFLYGGRRGWQLSPAYDLNPVPVDIKPRVLSTAIDIDEDQTASLERAFDVIDYFDLELNEAREIAIQVADAVSQWRSVAKTFGMTSREIERMESAFEHEDFRSALALRG